MDVIRLDRMSVMSKAEILAELPTLSRDELLEVQAKLDELAGESWTDRGELSSGEKALLDAELTRYRADPLEGSEWSAVRARVEAKLR